MTIPPQPSGSPFEPNRQPQMTPPPGPVAPPDLSRGGLLPRKPKPARPTSSKSIKAPKEKKQRASTQPRMPKPPRLPGAARPKRQRPARTRRGLPAWTGSAWARRLLTLAVLAALFTSLGKYVLTPTGLDAPIPHTSIASGDTVVLDKISPTWLDYRRGMVIAWPADTDGPATQQYTYGKVIALAGDEVRSGRSWVSVNRSETKIGETTPAHTKSHAGGYEVPAGQLLVTVADARKDGWARTTLLPATDVTAVVPFTVWPLAHAGSHR